MVGYNESKKTWFCEICKLNYRDKKLAEECQAWCSTHNSCNLKVTSQSIEAEKLRKKKNN